VRRHWPLGLAVWCAAAALLRAGPAEAAILAAMRLAEQPNYSWTTTITDDARTYDTEGKTRRGELTWVKMPVVNSIRRRLGRSVTDTQIELIFRGNVDCVIATDRGWKRPDDLSLADDEAGGDSSGGGFGGGLPGIGVAGGGTSGRGRSRLPEPERRYSNLQLAISHPHEELGVIVSSHQELKVEGDIVAGTLTDLGAQLLLVHDGQKEIAPVRATGIFKLWLRGGMVAKYQVRLEGVLYIETPKGRRQIQVHQTMDTIVKDVGTTTFEVPESARRQLLGMAQD
jgi:hypothetical protein